MDYSHITGFLDRFRKLISSSEIVNSCIAETLLKEIHIEIPTPRIKIKGTIIYVEGSPSLKNEIMVNKEGILKTLAIEIPHRNFTDIR